MLLPILILLALGAQKAISFPFMLDHPGVDTKLLNKHEKRQSTCPNNPVHKGAVPFNPQFPYTGARNGLPGTQIGGIEVPDDNDVAHRFEAPGPLDIRGPCPGLNTAANHHVDDFLQLPHFRLK